MKLMCIYIIMDKIIQFVDDFIFLLYQVIAKEISNINVLLYAFENNITKSFNVHKAENVGIANLLNFILVDLLVKYLGLPLKHGKFFDKLLNIT